MPTVLSPVWFLPGAQRWWVWKSQRSVAESEAEVLVTGRLSLGPCWLFWQKYLTKQRSWHSPDLGRMVNEDPTPPPRGHGKPTQRLGKHFHTSTLRRHHTRRKLESRKQWCTRRHSQSLPCPSLPCSGGRAGAGDWTALSFLLSPTFSGLGLKGSQGEKEKQKGRKVCGELD